jgi:arylsulfatase A-like enzyme
VQDWLVPEDSYGAKTLRFLDGHVTYSEILARHGYTLGMTGKWHMGDDEKAQRGFSYWHTVPGGGGTYRNPEFVTNGQRRKLTGYKTDLVGDGALQFLDTVKGNPFFLLVPFFDLGLARSSQMLWLSARLQQPAHGHHRILRNAAGLARR